MDPGSSGSRVPATVPRAMSAQGRDQLDVSKRDQFPPFISLSRLEFTYAFLYLTAAINWHVEKNKPLFPHSPALLK